MRDLSIRCAIWLKKQNLSKDDIVALTTYTQLNDFVPVLGSTFSGTVISPWSNELTSGKKFSC